MEIVRARQRSPPHKKSPRSSYTILHDTPFGPKSQICTSPHVLVKSRTALKFYQRVVRAQLNTLPKTACRNSNQNRRSGLSKIGEFGSMMFAIFIIIIIFQRYLATAISPTSITWNRTKFGTQLPYIIPQDYFWIYSKILNFSKFLDFSGIDLGLRYFTHYGVPGDGDFTNFHHAESNQIWYTASLHHSLGLFLDLFQNIEFFSTFGLFCN